MAQVLRDRPAGKGYALWPRSIAAMLALVVLTAMPANRTPAQPRISNPIPRPAVAAIVNAFDDHRLVAIGEMHRNEQVHALIRSLLHDRLFLPNGGDIVVEFGNARFQALMDRFTSGEDIPSPDLVRVWRETVNILVWDAPVYETFFRTVRAVNQTREAGHRLRVVLADPPIDWSNIHDRAAWEQVAAVRDRHAADVIDREVLNAGHLGLLIFGSGHVEHEDAFGPDPVRSPNVAELLQQAHPGVTLLVMADWMTKALDARLAGWHPP